MRILNKDIRKVQKRMFQCPVCGAVIPATKRFGKTNPGHVKTMYCYQCKTETDHVQIE